MAVSNFRTAAERVALSLEVQILHLTNGQRERNGLAPLQASPELGAVARDHSAEMLKLNYFKHESPTPGMFSAEDRIKHVARSGNVAENIFTLDGYPLDEIAQTTVDGWMNSPMHRGNILDSSNHYVGIGVALRTFDDQIRVMITQDFCAQLAR